MTDRRCGAKRSWQLAVGSWSAHPARSGLGERRQALNVHLCGASYDRGVNVGTWILASGRYFKKINLLPWNRAREVV